MPITNSRILKRSCARTLPTFAVFIVTSAMHAQSDAPDKSSFNVVSVNGGGNGFLPLGSSASASTQACLNAVQSNPKQGCAEHLSNGGGVEFGFGVRPIRYVATDFSAQILTNFDNSTSTTAPYQCVSGCNGIVTETIGTLHLLYTADVRGVLPLLHERLLISAGAGIAFVDVHQRPLTGGAQVQGGCVSCQPDLTGQGPLEVVEISYLPKRFSGHVGIGLQIRDMQIKSKGLDSASYNSLPGIRYGDQFLMVGAEMTFRFGAHH